MTFKEVKQKIKEKALPPVNFWYGEESFYLERLTELVEETYLEEHERAFNQLVYYGKDVNAASIIDACSRFPMMAERQLIILKEAQDLKNINALESYCKSPVSSTVLVIIYKKKSIDGRSSFGKLIKSSYKIDVLNSEPVRDYKLADWIETYAKSLQIKISPEASQIMAEYLGSDLSKIDNALQKMIINLGKNCQITYENVLEQIGISKDFNVFELNRAIAARDQEKVYRIVDYFAENPKNNPLIFVINSLFSYFSNLYKISDLKLSEEDKMIQVLKLRSKFFLREYKQARRYYPKAKIEYVFSVLKEYDLKSKGVENSASNSELIKEMIYKIVA